MTEQIHPVDILRMRVDEEIYLKTDTREALSPLERRILKLPTPSRSISKLSSHQYRGIISRISMMTYWMNEEGFRGNDYPDYDEWMENEFCTPEEIAKMHWINRGEYEVIIWPSSSSDVSDEEARLLMTKSPLLSVFYSDSEKLIDLTFKYGENDQYSLEILFGSKETTTDDVINEDVYISGARPLSEMTVDEYAVVTKYLDKVITDQQPNA